LNEPTFSVSLTSVKYGIFAVYFKIEALYGLLV